MKNTLKFQLLILLILASLILRPTQSEAGAIGTLLTNTSLTHANGTVNSFPSTSGQENTDAWSQFALTINMGDTLVVADTLTVQLMVIRNGAVCSTCWDTLGTAQTVVTQEDKTAILEFMSDDCPECYMPPAYFRWDIYSTVLGGNTKDAQLTIKDAGYKGR